ncbi:prepilin peptidase [Solibacillus silvestris]|uniref:prepilin peptidase n=1 Tax=Solibacillus silvestris TaxID=76853 RepID=UPI003F80F5E7
MAIMYTIFAGILGLVFGSFYNVVGLRVPKKESIVAPPSHCISCNRRLHALELVPVFSYLFLRGKCRTCGAKVSPIYAFTELVTGLLFAFATWQLGLTAELMVALLFVSLLVIINVSDIAYMLIPDKILLFFLPLLIIGRILSPLEPWWDSIIGAGLGFSLLLLIAIISKGGMGGGDIKLFLLIGLVLGTFNTLLTLFLASIIGMIAGLIMLKIRRQGRKTPIPFGPSIAIASLIVYFYGEQIISIYLNFLQ